MQFKTAQQIREEREAAGKDKEREARQREKLAEKARRKYDRMAEEAAKREAAVRAKPKLVVNRENVIVAPALLAEKAKPDAPVKRPGKDAAKAKVRADAAAVRAGEVSPSAGSEPHTLAEKAAKQVWDEATKQWVKRG
jgi:hypothetical protein